MASHVSDDSEIASLRSPSVISSDCCLTHLIISSVAYVFEMTSAAFQKRVVRSAFGSTTPGLLFIGHALSLILQSFTARVDGVAK